MLVDDEKKLCWLGLDMRPRERRRNTVAATYALFLAAVWWHPPHTQGALTVLLLASLTVPVWGAVEEATSKLISRSIMVVWGGLLVAAFVLEKHPHSDPGMTCWYALLLLVYGSVVGFGKMVERGGRGWLAAAILRGEKLSWRKQRRLARMGYAVGLDGFAWHEYGMRFKALTAEQKVEIQQMRRENPRGKWMRDRAAVLFDDERMQQEDDRVRASVQRTMSFLLMVSVFGAFAAYAWDWTVPQWVAMAWVTTVAGLSVTMRQAIVLWTEEDPRAVGGELVVMGQEA
jgi:hypothetical protein